MSRFLSRLRVDRLDDTSHDGRGTWSLSTPLVYESDVARRTIVVPAGFVTDLASVPRLPFAYLLTGGIAHSAAVIHDWLYTVHAIGSQPIDRATADAIFREAARMCGASAFQAWLMYQGVRLGGGNSWSRPGPKQPPIVATVVAAAP
ncbi:MAG TPA: DUF1353 domain-containing protein [Ramlibacter sp.]|nr:DUF1353 domain-containing protein [Ramlibacter sp.]